MSKNIQSIMKWYEQYNGSILNVETETHRKIELEINNNQLPHLLGLQYTQVNEEKRGIGLYAYAYGKNDEEIYKAVEANHPYNLEFVQDRIKTFEYFMKNLEKAVYVENTHPNTKIKSGHFLLETEDKRHMHLGLLSAPQGDIPTSFDVFSKEEVEKAKLETYFSRTDDSYYKDTQIKEPVIKIERYEMKDNELHLVPFSFDEEKRQQLIANSKKEIQKQPDTQQPVDKISLFQSYSDSLIQTLQRTNTAEKDTPTK